jgi:hypothetical protein
MFGSKQPIILNYKTIQEQMQDPQIKKILLRYNIQTPNDLMRHFALSRDQLISISASAKPATDTNLLAETFNSRYHSIKGNSMDTLKFLRSHFSYDTASYLKD